MELIDTLKIQQCYELSHLCLYIVGSMNLNHELISHFLQSECGIRCVYCHKVEQLLGNGENPHEQKNIMLFDVKEQDLKRFLFHLEDEYKKLTAYFNVALFNLEHRTGIAGRLRVSGKRSRPGLSSAGSAHRRLPGSHVLLGDEGSTTSTHCRHHLGS